MTHLYVASDHQDLTVRLYAITEAGSPQPLRKLELGGPVAACHAVEGPQGRVVAWTGWWPRGKLLNLRTGEEKETADTNIDGERVNSMRVLASYRCHSQAGGEGEGEAEAEARLVAGRFDGKVAIFDVRSGACLRVLGNTPGGAGEVLSLAVYHTSDGAPRLVSAGSGSRTASIWDPEDGRRLHDWQAAEASSVHIRVFGEGGGGGGGGEGHVAQLASCSMGENQLRVWAVGGVWGGPSVGHHARGVTACRWFAAAAAGGAQRYDLAVVVGGPGPVGLHAGALPVRGHGPLDGRRGASAAQRQDRRVPGRHTVCAPVEAKVVSLFGGSADSTSPCTAPFRPVVRQMIDLEGGGSDAPRGDHVKMVPDRSQEIPPVVLQQGHHT
jgi:hypothetical protein